MEDYKKLLERLREEPKDSRKAVLSIYDLCVDASCAIETLLDKLKYAEAERDVVSKRMMELEEQNAALRQQEHFREVTKKVEMLTNAQKIRAMSDEELEKFINRIVICHHLRNEGNCEKCPIHPAKPCDTEGILEWLQQPAEEDKHETD